MEVLWARHMHTLATHLKGALHGRLANTAKLLL